MNNGKDSLGDRMKAYEEASENSFIQGLPIIARLDGKAFHTFTRGLKKPYDERLKDLMVATTRYLVDQTNAIIGYTQSDEITLVWHQTDPKSELFMGARKFKMISLLAAMASTYFNKEMETHLPEKYVDVRRGKLQLFDCRIFEVPTREEAVNCLIWREQDAVRNSISSAAQSEFSHMELQNKSCSEMQEMLFQKGINWNNYPSFFKRGTYVRRFSIKKPFTTEEIEKLPLMHNARKNPDLIIERHVIETVDMPILTKIVNRTEVIFDGTKPQLKKEENHE